AITSIKEFISSSNFLGDLKLYITLPENISLDDLTATEKLEMVDKFLQYAENNIRLNYQKEKGTPYFEGVAMREVIKVYSIEVSRVNSKITSPQEIIQSRSMRGHDWYIYDHAIVNRWESDMIDFVHSYVEELKEKYNDVY